MSNSNEPKALQRLREMHQRGELKPSGPPIQLPPQYKVVIEGNRPDGQPNTLPLPQCGVLLCANCQSTVSASLLPTDRCPICGVMRNRVKANQ